MSNHESGYGKPPKHTRFKPGQSGNPNGRPKGHISTMQLLEKHLNTMVTVMVNRKTKRMTRREALIIKLVADAGNGKDKTLKHVLDIQMLHEAQTPQETGDTISDAQDEAVIKGLLHQHGVITPTQQAAAPLPAPGKKIKIIKANPKEQPK